jgi:hypothetical protein
LHLKYFIRVHNYGAYWGVKKYIEVFGGETLRKQTKLKTET